MSLNDAKEVSTESESDDKTTHVPGSMIESSKKKELKFFDFVTESGEHAHLTEEQISAQKKIEEEAKLKLPDMKVYREDDSSEIIPEFKASDLHLDDNDMVLENSETKEEDVKEDEPNHNKERYTFKDDDDDGEFDDLD
ncbi:hypothetical protein Tco_0621055 [Tanacetum coccineum]